MTWLLQIAGEPPNYFYSQGTRYDHFHFLIGDHFYVTKDGHLICLEFTFLFTFKDTLGACLLVERLRFQK